RAGAGGQQIEIVLDDELEELPQRQTERSIGDVPRELRTMIEIHFRQPLFTVRPPERRECGRARANSGQIDSLCVLRRDRRTRDRAYRHHRRQDAVQAKGCVLPLHYHADLTAHVKEWSLNWPESAPAPSGTRRRAHHPVRPRSVPASIRSRAESRRWLWRNRQPRSAPPARRSADRAGAG